MKSRGKPVRLGPITQPIGAGRCLDRLLWIAQCRRRNEAGRADPSWTGLKKLQGRAPWEPHNAPMRPTAVLITLKNKCVDGARGKKKGGEKWNKYVVYPNQGREYAAEGDSQTRMWPLKKDNDGPFRQNGSRNLWKLVMFIESEIDQNVSHLRLTVKIKALWMKVKIKKTSQC